MEGTCQNEVVICGQLAQAGLELALVDQAAGLVYDDEREYGPSMSRSVAGLNGHGHGGLDGHGEGVGDVWGVDPDRVAEVGVGGVWKCYDVCSMSCSRRHLNTEEIRGAIGVSRISWRCDRCRSKVAGSREFVPPSGPITRCSARAAVSISSNFTLTI